MWHNKVPGQGETFGDLDPKIKVMACNFQVTWFCKRLKSHISLWILFKFYKDNVWVRMLLEFKTGHVAEKLTRNRQKCFFSPKKINHLQQKYDI